MKTSAISPAQLSCMNIRQNLSPADQIHGQVLVKQLYTNVRLFFKVFLISFSF